MTMTSNNLTKTLEKLASNVGPKLGILFDPSQGYLLTERDGRALPHARLLGTDYYAATDAVRELCGLPAMPPEGPVVW